MERCSPNLAKPSRYVPKVSAFANGINRTMPYSITKMTPKKRQILLKIKYNKMISQFKVELLKKAGYGT